MDKMKFRKVFLVCFVGLSAQLFSGGGYGSAIAQSHYPGQHKDKISLKEHVPFKAFAFDLQDVKLLDSRFKENMKRESDWLMSFTVQQILHGFRTNAGIFNGLEGGYDSVDKFQGWESLDCELRGHSIGHMLSGFALLYASTRDEVYKTKSDSLVDGLAEVQKTLNQGGYLSAFPQNLIDRNLRGERVWAPWYTLHKLYSGLIDQYLYCNNEQALDVVTKMGMWAYNKLKNVDDEQRRIMLRNEFGGINDSFYTLYEITGKPEFKWLGEYFYHDAILDPLKEKVDNLEGMHANTYIPKLIGVIRAYEIGESEEYKEIADFFWNTVVDHHSFVTGSNSDKEKFFKPDHISHHLTGYTGESCNVYNMLKLTRHLFCIEGEVKYADYYEKALFNHILGQQDPQTGMIAYFLPMLPGAHKVYSTADSSFWCCVGTSFENHAKYGEAIYYHKDDNLFVNLFIPSELNWHDKGIVLRQKTNFPKESTSTFTIVSSNSQRATINILYPFWATSGVTVKVNGEKVKVKKEPGSYIAISEKWNKGDNIEVEFPMALKLQRTADNPDVAAVTYGPVVLAAKLGTEGMQSPAPFSNPNLHNDYYTYDYNIPESIDNVLKAKGEKIEKWLKPVKDEPLKFKTETSVVGKELEFVPLYDLHRERYNVYWELK